MVCDILTDDLLEDVSEFLEDLLFQAIGEAVPDGPW
jgi:hypothetical protein